MNGSEVLLSIFLAHLPAARAGAVREQNRKPLEQELEKLWVAAQNAWPQVILPAEDFLEHLGRHAPAGDLLVSLRQIRAEDLFLAKACATGQTEAIRAFDEQVLRRVMASLKSVTTGLDEDEISQMVRDRLLVADSAGGPRIGCYQGKGSLRGWVRITARNVAIDIRRRGRRTYLDGAIEERAEADPDHPPAPRVDQIYQRAQGRVLLTRALAAGLVLLSPEDRGILRQYYMEEHTLEEIATVRRSHRSTVLRRIEKACALLGEVARRYLKEERSLRTSEIEGLITSQLGASLSSLLRP